MLDIRTKLQVSQVGDKLELSKVFNGSQTFSAVASGAVTVTLEDRLGSSDLTDSM